MKAKSKKSKSVSRDEFDELRAIVKELAEAQKEAAKEQQELRKGLDELREAQKEAAKEQQELRKGLDELRKGLDELREAQKEATEERQELRKGLNELREGLNELREIVKNLAQQVAILTDARGYGLEAITVATLPSYLSEKYNIKAEQFVRKFVKVDGQEIELNLFAHGKRGEEIIPILVECKSQIYEIDVKNFYNKKIKPINEKIWEKTINVMTGYLIHPSGYEEAKKLDIIIVAGVPHAY